MKDINIVHATLEIINCTGIPSWPSRYPTERSSRDSKCHHQQCGQLKSSALLFVNAYTAISNGKKTPLRNHNSKSSRAMSADIYILPMSMVHILPNEALACHYEDIPLLQASHIQTHCHESKEIMIWLTHADGFCRLAAIFDCMRWPNYWAL